MRGKNFARNEMVPEDPTGLGPDELATTARLHLSRSGYEHQPALRPTGDLLLEESARHVSIPLVMKTVTTFVTLSNMPSLIRCGELT